MLNDQKLRESVLDSHLAIGKRELSKVLSNAQGLVERKTTISLLSNLLIKVDEGRLRVVSTDMDRVFFQEIPLNVHDSFLTSVDAHLFYDIVRKLDDKQKITFGPSENGDRLLINSGSAHFILPTLAVETFPVLNEFDYAHKITMQSGALRAVIEACKFAMSEEESRYNLNGVYLHYSDSMVAMAATDGHRIALSLSEEIAGLEPFDGIIIPKKTVAEICKIIYDLDEPIQILFSGNQVLFKGSNFMLLSKLVDAEFPLYQASITKDDHIRVKVGASFFAALDRVATITNSRFKGVKLTLDKNNLMLSTTDDIGNKAEESLLVETEYAGRLEIGVNAQYLLDVAGILREDGACVSLEDPMKPILIEKMKEANFQYIIMPMRV